MRVWLLSSVLVVAASVCAAPPAADPAGGIRLPVVDVEAPKPPPSAVTKLAADQLYVVDSDVELRVIASPEGLVGVSYEAGPIKMRGRFVENASGRVTTRTYRGPHVYTVEALKTGRVELLIVRADGKGAVIRRTLDVTGEAGPGPDPGPKPPDPPAPVTAPTWVIVVEETSARTPAIAAVVGDLAMWRRVEAKGAKWRLYDKDSPDVRAKKYDQFAAPVGLPAVLFLDATGKVVKAFKLPATGAELEAMVK